MKKATKITLGVVGGIIVIGAIASAGNKSNTETVTNGSNSKANTSQQQPAEQKPEKVTIKNSTFQEANGLQQVVGEITNNDSGQHSAILKATFYDANGKILGTAVGAVNDIAPGDTKTFNLLTSDDVSGYKDMKVQVDSLL